MTQFSRELHPAELPRQIAEAGDQLRTLAERMDALAREADLALEYAEPEEGVSAKQVRRMIRTRRLREQYFRDELFGDPAWDMMLELYAAHLEGQRVAVSSLCIAAAVPVTTALRWIRALSDKGIFVRIADPEDGRRVYMELSQEARLAMDAYMRAAKRADVAG